MGLTSNCLVLMGLTIGFIILQTLYLSRHIIEEEEKEEDNDTDGDNKAQGKIIIRNHPEINYRNITTGT